MPWDETEEGQFSLLDSGASQAILHLLPSWFKNNKRMFPDGAKPKLFS
jgi:hypothetical protein